MSKLSLYYDLLSQPSRTLYILFNTINIPFQAKEIRLGKGEHKSEEFKKMNPLQQVPFITDGNFNLAESIAIVRYLYGENKDLPDQWYPKESEARARVDEFLEFQHIGLRIHCGMYFRVMWLEPLVTQKVPNAEFVAELKKNMVRACDFFQKVWLRNGKKHFVCGDTITVADIFAATELEQPKLAGFDVRDGRPAVTDWLERVRNETQPHYDVAHATLNRLAEKYKGQSPGLTAKI